MKCYYTLFNIDGIKNNIGFYIISSIILFHLISIIIFYKIDYYLINNKITDIINNKININNTFKNNITKKKLIENKRNYSINVYKVNNIIENKNENSRDIIYLNKNDVNILKYNISELNNLSYNDALENDKRAYIDYYISL